MTDAIANDPKNKMTAWLSRGLLEACLGFIDAAKQGEGLRVAAYEFTYPPVLAALNDALKRGVDVQIVYHKTPVNDKAVAAAKLPGTKGGKQILFPRTKTKIPHNKFIVHLDRNGSATAVWTGSTNSTASGFLGQTNVGHLVTDAGVSKTYLAFWKELSGDPILSSARSAAVALTPDPANLIPAAPMTMVYSPRSDKLMLDWYAQRIVDGKTCVAFTGAFGVDATILKGLEQDAQAVRFILLEKPPTTDVRQAEQENHGNLLVSYGAVLGQTYQQVQGAKGGKKLVPIPHFELDKWFLEEELARQDGEGFVFFIHTKFLLVDPLSNDPLVCTGSANFSGNSLTANDENMLQIRGDTRVADIYLTEFDRIFRHFYFRDVANDVAVKGGQSTVIFLKDTDIWTDDYFNQAKFNYHRRLMFFANPANSWTTQAAADPSPFGSGGGQPRKSRGTTARKTGSTREKATGTAKKKAAPKRKTKKASPRKTKTKKVRMH
jgi:phosphatidylserine/phosphatidylglycerophosphate/cardiolipin synthase-like enzyme